MYDLHLCYRCNTNCASRVNVEPTNIKNGRLFGFTDEILANMFAVSKQLCGSKFELKAVTQTQLSYTFLTFHNNEPVSKGSMRIHVWNLIRYKVRPKFLYAPFSSTI